MLKQHAPRGLKPWNPTAKSRALLNDLLNVLDEYRDQLPLTLRQIFYRLVATEKLEKTESAYNRLLRVGNLGRRSGAIDWGHIRDDGISRFDVGIPRDIFSAAIAADDRLNAIKNFRPNGKYRAGSTPKGLNQPVKVIVLTESAGMAPMIARVVNPWGMDVRTSGGFDSSTAKYDLARLIANS